MFEVGGEPFYSYFSFLWKLLFLPLISFVIQKHKQWTDTNIKGHNHPLGPVPKKRNTIRKKISCVRYEAYSTANHAGHAKDGVVSVSHRHGQHTEKSYTRTCQNMCPLCHRVLYRVVSFSDQYASPNKTINLSPYT